MQQTIIQPIQHAPQRLASQGHSEHSGKQGIGDTGKGEEMCK